MKDNTAMSEKKVLVFLHYFGGSGNSWNWVIDNLQDEFKCIAFDIPGFGNAVPLEEPSLVNFAIFFQKKLESLKIVQYTLIGHSMGAKIAMQMAANIQKPVIEQLILLAPSPPKEEPIEEQEKSRMLHHPSAMEANETIKNITKVPLSAEKYDLAMETNLIADPVTWNWWLKKGMITPIKNITNLLKWKVSLLNSSEDPVITPQIITQRVIDNFEQVDLFTNQQSGHLIPMENPGWVVDIIRNIVRK